MKYYIAKDGQPVGPFTVDELKTQGITPDTLVWNDSLPQWTRAGAISELSAFVTGCAQPVAPLPESGYQQCQTPYSTQPCSDPYQQNYPNAQPGYQPVNDEMPPSPKTWLAESILVTLFCCLPFGIVSIVKASQVSSAYSSGNYDDALKQSQSAGKWVKIAFFCGLAGILLYLISIISLALFSTAGTF